MKVTSGTRVGSDTGVMWPGVADWSAGRSETILRVQGQGNHGLEDGYETWHILRSPKKTKHRQHGSLLHTRLRSKVSGFSFNSGNN